MLSPRRSLPLLAVLTLVLCLAACSSKETTADGFQWKPLFGNGLHDSSDVVATVGDIQITKQDLDLRFDELPQRLKNDYQGEEGRRLLLKEMVDQALMVMGAVETGLYNDEDVARSLISQRRSLLDSAMRNYGLLRDNEPTEEDIKAFFDQNRDLFRQQPTSRARHVECLTRDEAEKAYERLVKGGFENTFPKVVKDFSKNFHTAKESGELGWFNEGGFVPGIENTKEFTTEAIKLEPGLHPPFRIGSRWHVVEIQNKEYGRPMTYKEAHDIVLKAMMPAHQEKVIKDYLRQARQEHPVAFLGEYAPGKGLTAEQIFVRGMGLADPQKKLDMFNLIISDYPESDRADDALFMSGLVTLDTWNDRRAASIIFQQLREEYPDSDYMDNIEFLEKNGYDPDALTPSSIEELRKNQ